MEEASKHLLSKLYSLRAGLSLVAQEKQIVDEIYANAEQKRATEIRQVEGITVKVAESINFAEGELKNAKLNYLNATNEANSCIKKQKKLVPGFVVLPLLAIILIALSILAAIAILKHLHFSMLTYAALILALAIVMIILFFINLKTARKLKSKYIEIEETLPLLKDNINFKQIKLQDSITTLEEAQKLERAKKANIESRHKQDRAIADPHLQTAKVTIESLHKEFGEMIDARDWENLDVIIYSIETRRAETLKEALMCVDSEKRADRVTQAIEVASNEIQYSIRCGLSELRSEMNTCFNGLSKQITNQACILSNQINGVHSAVLEASTTSTALTNALLAQSNKTSAELANDAKLIKSDVKYIKDRVS